MLIENTIKPVVNLATGDISLFETESNSLFHDEFDPRKVLKQHAIRVVQTRDAAVREALIKLGWTPPPEERPTAPASHESVMRVRANDPASSVLAADRAATFASSHQDRILRALSNDELSSHQIAKLSGLTVVQVDRRLPELKRDGRVEVVMNGCEELLRDGYRVWRIVRPGQIDARAGMAS